MKKAERQEALAEFQRTRDILRLHRRLGHKHLRSTVNLIMRQRG